MVILKIDYRRQGCKQEGQLCYCIIQVRDDSDLTSILAVEVIKSVLFCFLNTPNKPMPKGFRTVVKIEPKYLLMD